MRSLLLFGALLLGVALAEDDPYTAYRTAAAEAMIEDLEEAVKEINDRWDNKIKPMNDEYFVRQRDLRGAVNTLEGRACPEGRWHCNSGECVGNVAVCDGNNDCADGSDEDAHWCAIETPAGTVLEGHADGHDGCTKRHPDSYRIVVNYAHSDDWMPNYVNIGAALVVAYTEDGEHKSHTFNCKGHYDFAQRNLVLASPENDRLGVTCRFNGIRHDVCEGAVRHEATNEACVTFQMRRLEYPHTTDS